MEIYHFDPNTKIFLGSDIADESPLEPGIYLIPAYATDVVPPQAEINTIPVFDENSKTWSLISTLQPPLTLDETKANKLSDLSLKRFEVETGGITLNGTEILTDRESQSLATSAYISLLNGLLTNINWKAVNGWVSVTLETFTPVAQAIANHIQGCFNNEKVHSDAINALTDSQSVIDYDITTGWPSN